MFQRQPLPGEKRYPKHEKRYQPVCKGRRSKSCRSLELVNGSFHIPLCSFFRLFFLLLHQNSQFQKHHGKQAQQRKSTLFLI